MRLVGNTHADMATSKQWRPQTGSRSYSRKASRAGMWLIQARVTTSTSETDAGEIDVVL